MKAQFSKGKRFFTPTLVASIMLALALTLTSCAEDPANDSGGGGGDNNGGLSSSSGGNQNGGGGNSTIDNAISVSVGYSASHTISASGEHWFKFVGDGNPVIFETTGNVVDTYMTVEDADSWFYIATDDNSGEGSNALISKTLTSGKTYWIKITAKSSTYGTYTFAVE
jgi:hypothetical protein